MSNPLNNKGYTLVEVLITLTVIGVLLGIVGNFAVNALTQTTVESVRASQLGQTQIAMDKAINDIRLSAGADIVNRWSDPNNTNGSFSWRSNANTLLLSTVVMDSSDNVIFADASKYISEKNSVIYFVKDKTLYKRTLASTVAGNTAKTTCPAAAASSSCPADSVMLNDVSSFTLKYLDNNNTEVTPTDARSVELSVQTATKRFGQDIKSGYTTRAVFRND